MKEQQQIIEKITNADINQDNWLDDILEDIKNTYAKGYLQSKVESLNGIFSYSDEEFRERMLEFCDYDIWK
jgi:hypothetical protein